MQLFTRRLLLAGSGAALAVRAAEVGEHPVSGAWDAARLSRTLIPRDKWHPFPALPDRADWDAVAPDIRNAVLEEANGVAGKPWADLPASLFLEFKRTGNRSHYEAVSFGRRNQLVALVLAECFEAKGRLLDDIANGIWAICEESFWGVPASFANRDGLPDITDPTVELFAAETSALLAWTDYLLGAKLDSVSKQLRVRMRLEADQRILAPGLKRDDFGWMGLRSKNPVNNWNPWICSNWLVTALLLDPDEARRAASVRKIMLCLDRFLATYPEDGGCDEGPSYWTRAGASLFECLEWMRLASNGEIDLYSMPLVREIGRYVYKAHIAGEWFVNFADAPARIPVSGDLIYRFGRAIKDEPMMSFGAWGRPAKFSSRGSIGRALPAIFNDAELRKAKGAAPLLRDAWFPNLQVMTARMRAGETKGLYVAAQGGHNAESHNHNDVGNFIVYSDGEPAIIDVGVETYTAKTFSSKRYEIWTMQSAFHNCPSVNGVMQSPGRQFRATEVSHQSSDRASEFSMDIAKAYPPEAGIKSWRRIIRLDRTNSRVEVADNYALAAAPRDITLTLMTPLRPATADGVVDIPKRARVLFDPRHLSAKVEEIPLTDANLRRVWGPNVYRIQLGAKAPAREGSFSIRIEPAG